jgi:predicted RNase H-like HicB family nuclease
MTVTKVKATTPSEYLKKPYVRSVVPEADGSYSAEIIEFPGCIAVGDTAAQALENLENVAESWLESTIARGQRVPDPIENVGYSGKLVLRLPKTLHRKATHVAAREGVSLNQFIVTCIAEQVGGARAGAPLNQLRIMNTQFSASLFVQVGLLPATAFQHRDGTAEFITGASGNAVKIGVPVMFPRGNLDARS